MLKAGGIAKIDKPYQTRMNVIRYAISDLCKLLVQEWSAIVKRVGGAVGGATVLLEDLAEGVAAAAVEGASIVSRGRQGGDVGPQVAVELLWRLRHMGLSDAAEGPKVTASLFPHHPSAVLHSFRHLLSQSQDQSCS